MSLISLKASLLVMGLSGIIAQILLLRELLVSFLGNELTIGIILANWLILEAIGSFLVGRSVEKTEKKAEFYVLLQLVFALAFPLAIYLARTAKNIIAATPGEGLGFIPVVYLSFLILLPASVPHGALFTYGCKLYARFLQEAPAVGRVYILETIGSILGGLLVTFFLVQHFHSVEIALGVSLANALVSLPLVWPGKSPSSFRPAHLLWALSLFLAFAFAASIFTGQARVLHLASLKQQWRGLDVIHNENSFYGNLSVIQSQGQLTFYTDGVPAITTPHPDIARVEDFVHFPLLYHRQPETVLVLGGGAGGILREILKYPIKTLHYVELDPRFLQLIRKFPTPLTEAELADPRVMIHYTDGRFFLNETRQRFDLVFIGPSLPQDLQTNRLFSREFFTTVQRKMNPGGIMILSLPGSLSYLGPELKKLNGCLLDTLQAVFRQVTVVVGDTNLYLAADEAQAFAERPEELFRRLQERGVPSSLFSLGYLEHRLQERWRLWFQEALEGRERHINSDFRPLGVYFSLSYLTDLFTPGLTGWLNWFEGINLKFYLMATVLATLLAAAVFLAKPALVVSSVPWAIFTTGFASMILDLAIIFTFQTLFGYLYFQIGLLVTIFMAGVALGGIYITRRRESIHDDVRLFLYTEILLVMLALCLPFVFLIPAPHLDHPFIYAALYANFLIMSLLSGFFVGLQFPLAGRIYLGVRASDARLGDAAGMLYGADLLGGFCGGLLGGVVLLPVLGLKETCFLLAGIKSGSLLLFYLFDKYRPAA